VYTTTDVQKKLLDRLIKGLRPTTKSARALALLAKYNIFDKNVIKHKLKQLEGDNVLLFTAKQSNQGS
jgi:hypothetical protein|tara:strand:- start:100 stop:303 length:204 start_codon:yes stop_codon:yes gene_type:complete